MIPTIYIVVSSGICWRRMHISVRRRSLSGRRMYLFDRRLHPFDRRIHLFDTRIHLFDRRMHLSDRRMHLSDKRMHLSARKRPFSASSKLADIRRCCPTTTVTNAPGPAIRTTPRLRVTLMIYKAIRATVSQCRVTLTTCQHIKNI